MGINIIASRSTSQGLLFHFRSVLLCYRWNYMKAISFLNSMCGLCERWDSGIKPTCFASSQQACVLTLCAHTCKCINLYVLVHIRAGTSVKLTPQASWCGLFGSWEMKWPPTHQPSSECKISSDTKHPFQPYPIIVLGLLLWEGFICIFRLIFPPH